jgi:hypothetical protein
MTGMKIRVLSLLLAYSNAANTYGDSYGDSYGSANTYGDSYGSANTYGDSYGASNTYGQGYGDSYGNSYGDSYGNSYGDSYGAPAAPNKAPAAPHKTPEPIRDEVLEYPSKGGQGHGVNPGVSPPKGTGKDWWFDLKTPCNSEGNKATWRTAARKLADRSKQRGQKHVWEVQSRSKGTWYPLHTDPKFLARVEELYVSGKQYLPYAEQYAKLNPDNHRYVIDFEHMKQIDVFFPCDYDGSTHGPFNIRRRQLD